MDVVSDAGGLCITHDALRAGKSRTGADHGARTQRGAENFKLRLNLLLQLRFQPCFDGRFRLCANELIDELAILKNQQRGNASYIELTGGARILVDIELRDFVAAERFRR